MDNKKFWTKLEEAGGLTPELTEYLKAHPELEDEAALELMILQKARQLPGAPPPEYIRNRVMEHIPEKPERGNSFTEKLSQIAEFFLPSGKMIPVRQVAAGFALGVVVMITMTVKYLDPGIHDDPASQQVKAISQIETDELKSQESIQQLLHTIDANKDLIDQNTFEIYRQKLAVIDEFIKLCREATDENSYNLNARYYLQQAYKDKISVLTEVTRQIKQ